MPDLVRTVTTPAELRPYCAEKLLVSTRNSRMASGLGSGLPVLRTPVMLRAAVEVIGDLADAGVRRAVDLHVLLGIAERVDDAAVAACAGALLFCTPGVRSSSV